MNCPIYFTWSGKKASFLIYFSYVDFTKKSTKKNRVDLSCTHRIFCSLFTSQLSAKPIPEQAVWQIDFPPLRISSPSRSWASDTCPARLPIGGPVPLPPSSNASSARSRVDSKSLHQNRNQRFCIKNNLLGGRKINPRKITKNGCLKRSIVPKWCCAFPIPKCVLYVTYNCLFFFSTSFGYKF